MSFVDERVAGDLRFAKLTGKFLLRKDLLAAFKRWLDSEGIKHRPPTELWGDSQVLAVNINGGWQSLYRNKSFKEHYTVPAPLKPLVSRFLAQQA